MAQIYNPWESPPTEHTLSGDLASFEINGEESPEMENSEHGKPLKEALSVISQQSQLIAKLMAMLDPSASSASAPALNSNEFISDSD